MVSSIGRHARQSARARDGLVAGALGVCVLLIALATVGLGSSAQASSQSFTLFSQINNTGLQAPTENGSKNVEMTVTPATAARRSDRGQGHLVRSGVRQRPGDCCSRERGRGRRGDLA